MERFILNLPAVISVIRADGTEEYHELPISNVCAGGVFLKTKNPLPVGTKVMTEMILPLDEISEPGGKRTIIKISGVVIRTEEEGMAIRFDKKYQISPLSEEDAEEVYLNANIKGQPW